MQVPHRTTGHYTTEMNVFTQQAFKPRKGLETKVKNEMRVAPQHMLKTIVWVRVREILWDSAKENDATMGRN